MLEAQRISPASTLRHGATRPHPRSRSLRPVRSLVQSAPAAEAAPLDRGRDRRALSCADAGRMGATAFSSPSSRPMRRITGMSSCGIRSASQRAAMARSCAQAPPCCPDEATLCATAWMHGVFAAQLTIGNTSFHKLFSVSRDPYNVDARERPSYACRPWRRLAPFSPSPPPSRSALRLPLDLLLDGRADHDLGDRIGDDPAMQWRIAVEGEACRFLSSAIDSRRARVRSRRPRRSRRRRQEIFVPSRSRLALGSALPASRLSSREPARRIAIEALGGDELLYADGGFRGGAYAAIRTTPTHNFSSPSSAR